MTFDSNDEISCIEKRSSELNPQQSALPRYKIKDRSRFWSSDVEIEFPGSNNGNSPLGPSFARFLNDLPLSDHTLDMFLQRKIATAEHARKRKSSFFGRVLNLMLGENPDFIKMDRKHFLLCLELLNEETSEKIHANAECFLRLDAAHSARVALLRRMQNANCCA